MNTQDDVTESCSVFEEFEYRLVYLRPSAYSDERIAVGVIANRLDHLESRFVSSVDALNLMTRIFGEDGVEQFHFATTELRRVLAKAASLDSIVIPTDLLAVGDKVAAFTADRNGLLTSILASSSCLIRSQPARSSEVLTSSSAPSLTRDLFDHVSRLNPLIAKDLFDRQITIEGETVELPIYGNKIFGAPVSFVARDLRMRAESYVAKFVWLRQYLKQKPRIYVLTRQDGVATSSPRADSSIRELRAIADASKVPLRTSESTDELAVMIVHDEAA
jgi:hypothetical protein